MASRAFLPPRFLAAALTLLCLTTLDVSAQAASGWLFHVDVVGTPKTTRTNSEGLNGQSTPFTAPADAMNGISIGSYASGHAGDGASPGQSQSCGASISLSVKITATWQGSDPVPPSVEIIETGQATASATIPANYDTKQVTSNDGLEGSDATGVAKTPANAVPPTHLTRESGSTWSITRSFSATASSSVNVPASAPQTGYSCGSDASLDSYTVKIHAQPYGWYDVGWTDTNGTHHAGPLIDNTKGTLTFEYGWRSTDGNLADLQGISMYEYLSYSGPGTFSADNKTFYPGPPTTSGYSVFNGKAGSLIDPTHLYAVDNQSPFPTTSSLTAVTWTAAQKYEFDDPVTGEVGTVLYSPGNIIDAVQLNPNQFYVSKSGYSATKPL